MPSSNQPSTGASQSRWTVVTRRAGIILRCVALLLAITSVILGVLIWSLQFNGIGDRSSATGQDVYFYLLINYEPQILPPVAAGFLFLYTLIRWPQRFPSFWPGRAASGRLTYAQIAGLSLIVVVVVAVGRHFVYHDYDGCADEVLAHFQSEIFAAGHVFEPIPDKWQPFINAATIPFLTLHQQEENWCSEFLPVHSLMRVPATLLGLDGYACALFLGLNLVLFYHLVRRLWPHHPTRATIGVLLFAIFPQVLVTSMSSYAMETHALVTTIWLLLFISEDARIFLLTPWFGILCMGIHQPHIHPIFAAPFILLLAWERRFFDFFYFCAVYLAGLVFWVAYLHVVRPSSVSDGLFNKFGFNPWIQMLVQPGNVGLLLSWSPLALSLLFVCAWVTLRRKDSFVFCSLMAFTLLAAFYLVWPTQIHGWGDRFLYPAIPFIVIVSLHSLTILRAALGPAGTRNVLIFSTLFVLAVQLPYRLREVENFESTHRALHDIITHTDADVVLLDTEPIWYGRDFVQNNPFLSNRPVVLSLTRLTPGQVARLKEENLSLKILGLDDIRATGHPAAFMREQD